MSSAKANVTKVLVEGTCICGGKIMVGPEYVVMHTLPTCADYERVETVADATELLRRVNVQMRRH